MPDCCRSGRAWCSVLVCRLRHTGTCLPPLTFVRQRLPPVRVGVGEPSPSCLVVRPLMVTPTAVWLCFCPSAAPCVCSCFAHAWTHVHPLSSIWIAALWPMPAWAWRDVWIGVFNVARAVHGESGRGQAQVFKSACGRACVHVFRPKERRDQAVVRLLCCVCCVCCECCCCAAWVVHTRPLACKFYPSCF